MIKDLIKKSIVILTIIVVFPFQAYCVKPMMNFLPMEDAMASTRDLPDFVDATIKPYRETLSFVNKDSNKQSMSFTNTDILAFIALAGVYILLVRRNAKPRNISF